MKQKQCKNGILKMLSAVVYCIQFSMKTSRLYTIIGISLSIFMIIIPFFSLYLTKILIDLLTQLNQTSFREVMIVLLFMYGLSILNILLGKAVQYIQNVHNDLMERTLQMKLMEKSMSFDLEFFDKPEYIDAMQAARMDAGAINSIVWSSCVVDSLLLETLGLSLGDTIVIAPSEGDEVDNEKAPSFVLELVGSYVNNEGAVFPYGLITTNRIFLSSEGRLLYNTNMMEKFCFYRSFMIDIEPVFNREFERIEETLKEIIGEDYILYSNVRVLKQAVRPLEQKVALQEKLVLPLSILFVLASCVVAYLTTISFQTEVFLRLLWGEKRWVVFGKMTTSLCPHLLIAFFVGCFLTWGISGRTIDSWLIGYLVIEVIACLFTAAVANLIVSRQNLIKAYQAREE